VGPYRLAGDYDGSILDPMLQPGSGSLDLVGSVQIARPAWGLNWSLAGSYQRTTANELEYRFGDEVIATLSAGRVVAGALSASLQAKWIHKARSEFHGEGVPSTGYTFGYLVPGIRLALPGQTAFYGFFHVAVHRHVNDAQLAPSAAFLLGFSKTL
jgi:hypothetical protein